jgi:gamma-glutamyltranspeptidase/glutathione hydrolase
MAATALGLFIGLALCSTALARNSGFAGVVSSASPEATAAGVEILEAGGNAIDAAVAVSLALGVSEPAGSGIAGQTVMLVRQPGKPAFVINGSTLSPAQIPAGATDERLRYGHSASTVPSTLRVLDLAYRQFGSGRVDWGTLLQPAIRVASDGFVIGPFRARSFAFYGSDLLRQPAAAAQFMRADGLPYQAGELFRQPLLAGTLQRLAENGAMDFYTGAIATEIAGDMAANGGWITAEDLAGFPEPRIVPALSGRYRGLDIHTLPPPFGGWVVLQMLNVLEQLPAQNLATPGAARQLALLDALYIGHESRRSDPVRDYLDYAQAIEQRTDKAAARRLLADWQERGGETTHFSVVDGDGLAVSVTQSIDSYFGAKVVHPTLGFLYNNYMQGFQVDDPAAPYYLEESQMPKSSMSATIASRNGDTVLVLGSPGSARIISAVTQVTSHWADVGRGIEQAVADFRVHVVPPERAYVEGELLEPALLAGMAQRGLSLARPAFGVADSQLDPYFGGVHALALEGGNWTGAADPRRDGRVGYARRLQP